MSGFILDLGNARTCLVEIKKKGGNILCVRSVGDFRYVRHFIDTLGNGKLASYYICRVKRNTSDISHAALQFIPKRPH